jgi:copper ion binding protein
MTTTVKVNGMSCGHCSMAVTKALGEIEGLSNVNVNLEQGTASFDSAKPVDMKKITEKIEKAGYEVV